MPIPQKRSKTRSRAGEAGELGGDRVEALGHLGVGLEEGAVGHLEVEAAELLAQALLAEHPGRAVGAAGVALDLGVEVDRRAREAGRGGDQAGLQLAGAPPLADGEVAQHAAAGAGVVGGDVFGPRPFADRVAGRVAGLGGEVAVLDVDDQVPAAAGVEAERRLAVLVLAEGVLELVAVAPGLGSAPTISSSSKPSRPPSRPSASATCACFSASWRS